MTDSDDDRTFFDSAVKLGQQIQNGKRAGAHGAEVGLEKALARVRAHDFTPPIGDWDQLVLAACAMRNRNRFAKGDPVTPASRPEALNKVVVTYLRYATGFTDEIEYARGKIGAMEARELAAQRATSAIVTVFPRLEAECNRQLLDASFR